MTNQELIKVDRMRYTKNKLSSNLAILAILFDVFYFVSIYKSDVSTYYYNILVGGSVIYNLMFMLAVFLSSEGVKTYNKKYSYLLIVIGILQFVRIFIIPARAHAAVVTIAKQEKIVMETAQFVRCIIYLCLSGVCCLSSAVIGLIRSSRLEAYLSTLGEEVRRD